MSNELDHTLIFAASCGYAKVVRWLLSAGANPNAENEYDYDGWSALGGAAYDGNAEVVKLLLAAGANVNAGGRRHGDTALMLAAFCGHGEHDDVCVHTEIVKILLAAGANPNATDNDGATALMSAAYNGKSEVVKILLMAGANPNMENDEGTALFRAKKEEHSEVVRILEEAGAKE